MNVSSIDFYESHAFIRMLIFDQHFYPIFLDGRSDAKTDSDNISFSTYLKVDHVYTTSATLVKRKTHSLFAANEKIHIPINQLSMQPI